MKLCKGFIRYNSLAIHNNFEIIYEVGEMFWSGNNHYIAEMQYACLLEPKSIRKENILRNEMICIKNTEHRGNLI